MTIKQLFTESLDMLKKRGGFFFLKKAFLLIVKKMRLYDVCRKKYHYISEVQSNEIRTQLRDFSLTPLMSIVIYIDKDDLKLLRTTLESVFFQWYKNYEIIIINEKNYIIDFDSLFKNIGFNDMNNVRVLNCYDVDLDVINELKGIFVCISRIGDKLTENALYEVIEVINTDDFDVIYSDHDLFNKSNVYYHPNFKSDYNEEMLLSLNYIRNLTFFRISLIQGISMPNKSLFNNYRLLLKSTELSNNIYHIRKVLFHEFEDKKKVNDDFFDVNINEITDCIKRRGLNASVKNGIIPNTVRIKRKIVNEPLVSIIIPFCDKPDLLKLCVYSILDKSSYSRFEIICVSNNSKQKATFDLIEELKKRDSRIRFLFYDIPFNFSEINNHAVSYANGEHLILLNNDIEIISNDWIESLLEYSQYNNVGAVGGLLFYPDNTIQHAGIIIGIKGVAGHSHKHFKSAEENTVTRPFVSQYLSAVTAACLMIKTNLYHSIGGLNSIELSIAFNDVDLCLRLREKGFVNVYTPYCQAYHHESISRGYDNTPEKALRFNNEIDYMKMRHSNILKNGDPYYNPNLSNCCENFGIK